MKRDHSVHENYFRLVQPQSIAAEFYALRNESADARQILAYGATRGQLGLKELYAALRAGATVELHAEWAARLARVMAWQNYLPDDRQLALDIFARVMPKLDGKNIRHAKLRQAYAEVLLAESQFDAAWRFMSADAAFQDEQFWHYWTDIYSPFLGSPHADDVRWSNMFNAHFERHGLVGVDVEQGPGAPFDSVVARVSDAAAHDDGPLVTVIMTTFRPERTPLIAAVRSILAQTWQRLELVIVDDASPPEFLPTLQEAAGLDPRIRLERMPVNGGTYLARNRALELASGEFFTNQDADDWSHPQRIERQLRPMLDDPDRPGTRAAALTLDSSLRQTRPGYGYSQQHAATFMSRVDLVRDLGGYLPARRAADNELHRRVEAFTDRKVLEIGAPLALYRIEPDSLSRGDFRAGWSHPARQSFIASYAHWHASARRKDLVLKGGRTGAVAVPQRFQVRKPAAPVPYDLVVLTDWRFEEPIQRAAYDEVLAAVAAGKRVGIAHMESPLHISPRRGNLAPSVQTLINAGRLDRVLLDDDATVERLIVRDPSVLQYKPIGPARLRVAELIVAVDDGDIEAEGSWFSLRDCTAACESTFGVTPNWRRETLRPAAGARAATGAVGPYVHLRTWATDRRRWRGELPVVGWIGDLYPARKLDPRIRSYIRQAVGLQPELDVRIRASERTCRMFAGKRYAATWTRFRHADISARAFVQSIDFVLATDPQPGSYRVYLEALAAGCIVVAPPSWESELRGAAVYAEVQDVASVLTALRRDRTAADEQIAKSQAFLREETGVYSYGSRLTGVAVV